MKVQDVMTSPAHSCTPDTTLGAAARAMRDYGCGALPVLDDAGRPVGIVTDRDVCMAVARLSNFPSVVPVRDVMTVTPVTCDPGTELEYVLEVMAECRVRRLPVVNSEARLVGIVSLSDIVLAVQNTQHLDSPLLRRLVAASRQIGETRPWHQGPVLKAN